MLVRSRSSAVERLSYKQQVLGSSPSGSTKTMNNFQYDAIVVLGGGKNDEGLTDLSKQRFDLGAKLYQEGSSRKIFALGGRSNSFRDVLKTDFEFTDTAKLRREYLEQANIPLSDIIELTTGADTVYEAFAVTTICREKGLGKVLLVTSDKHMDRSSFIFNEVFRRIFKEKDFLIGEEAVSCGDLLSEQAEREILALTKNFFAALPRDEEPDFNNWRDWYHRHWQDFYGLQLEIQNRYYTKESQAYAGVKEAK